jgi:hypothetical protein
MASRTPAFTASIFAKSRAAASSMSCSRVFFGGGDAAAGFERGNAGLKGGDGSLV